MGYLRAMRRDEDVVPAPLHAHRLALAALRGFVFMGLVALISGGSLGITGGGLAILTLMVGVASGCVWATVVLGAAGRAARLAQREPSIATWRRQTRIVRLRSRYRAPGYIYVPISHDAPLTRRGIIELWILSGIGSIGVIVLFVVVLGAR